MMKRTANLNLFLFLLLICGLFGCSRLAMHNIALTNGTITIQLAKNNKGIPYIDQVISTNTGQVFLIDSSEGMALQTRIENNFLYEKAELHSLSDWEISEDSVFIKAQALIGINQTKLGFHVELMKDKPLCRIYCTAQSDTRIKVKEFPIFCSSLFIPDSASSLRWWKAVDYTLQQEPITSDTRLSLNSRIYSSDNYNGLAGHVPYWLIENARNTIGFSLAWCGGWRANLSGEKRLLNTDIYLPESETQLCLETCEIVKGPELTVFFTQDTNPILSRKSWIEARAYLAKRLYPVPDIKFPLIYNHWYSVEFNLSEAFIKNQVKWFDDYGFNVFMIDAGWYENVGSWTPNQKKFSSGQFSKAIGMIKSSGAIAGLWSCPQLFSVGRLIPEYIDQPGRFSPFMNAWLVDYNAMDFNKFLTHHLDTLTNQLGAGWWKFDQDFFAEMPRSGKMKSVIALQNALATVRETYPKLIIEACLGGGKMINEFTDEISQIHWIRDGSRTGYLHAVSNINEALGAIGFLEPQKVQRWNNRVNEIDMKEPDLMKYYCRSCMIGTWGISADLNKISLKQKAVILNEIRNYRQLNEIKKYNLVDFSYPGEYTSLIPVTFYNDTFTEAGILLYRMFPEGYLVRYKFKTMLMPNKTYSIRDADSNSTKQVTGNEIELDLMPGQNSAIYFIKESGTK